MKVYFICMGNYYRSRLAQELCSHYADLYQVSLTTDSGGIDKIPNPDNPGSVAPEVLQYLEELGITPHNTNRLPRNCASEDLSSSKYIVCTYEKEQRELFESQFPAYKDKVIYWDIPDTHDDPDLVGPDRLHLDVIKLVAKLKKDCA